MWLTQVNKGVPITIGADTFQIEVVAACFAFLPQTLAAPRKKPSVTCIDGPLDRFSVGEADHQHLTRAVVLNDDACGDGFGQAGGHVREAVMGLFQV